MTQRGRGRSFGVRSAVPWQQQDKLWVPISVGEERRQVEPWTATGK